MSKRQTKTESPARETHQASDGPAVVVSVIALEALGSMQRLEELGVLDRLGDEAADFIIDMAPQSLGGRPGGESAWDRALQIVYRIPETRASIAKIRRFNMTGDVEAIFIELEFWLGFAEGLKRPGRVERDA
jgi:hypothetical protein